jgi:hypothetical protein
MKENKLAQRVALGSNSPELIGEKGEHGAGTQPVPVTVGLQAFHGMHA